MTDLLIAGGTVVDTHTARRADVLVRDGRVAAIVHPDTRPSVDQTLDATGLHVLPGVVDGHVHFNEPGRTDWEGFETGSRAAGAGGTTTVCDMPLNCTPPTLDAATLAYKVDALRDRSVVDYALWGGVTPTSLDKLPELKAGGVVGVKGFLCDSGLAEFPPLADDDLAEAMRRCADLDVLLALHAEDAVETAERTRTAQAHGRNGPLDWARARPPSTEVRAVSRALELAATTSVRLHFVHISTGAAARLVASARQSGVDVTVETCPHYLTLDESDLDRAGALAKCAPPLRPRDVVDDLWTALIDGAIDYVASDHSPCPPAMKTADTIWGAWGGLGGVQSLLSVLLTEGPRRGLDLPRIVELTSARPADRLGLSPRKGALAVGSDADLVLVDLSADWTPDIDALQTRWRLDPFVGRRLTACVRSTLVRGRLVWQDGAPAGTLGSGQRQLVRA